MKFLCVLDNVPIIPNQLCDIWIFRTKVSDHDRPRRVCFGFDH